MPDEDQTRILRGRPTSVGPSHAAKPELADAAEEATRVLTARDLSLLSDAPRAQPAGQVSDKIVFTCPNGDRIVVAAHLAGKRGKCTKCGVDVQIPGGQATAPSPAAVPGPTTKAEEGISAQPAVAEMPAEEAPAPSLDMVEPDAGAGGTAPLDESSAGWGFVAGGVEGAGEAVASAADWEVLESGGLFDEEGANPTAYLVARLWAERQHGGVIELHLAGGSVILPSYFDAAWSRGTHGLFGKEELDGSYTLTAVAWGTVEKVIVRQLTAVPPDMFPSS